MHGGIWKLFGRNDHHDKTMCRIKNYVARWKVKVTAGTVKFVHSLIKFNT